MSASLRTASGWDQQLFLATAGLVLVSGLAMVSAAVTVSPTLAWRHGAWIAIGVALYGVISLTNYRRWLDVAAVVYILSVLALVLVPLIGPARLGATRWLSVFGFSLQPSELAKLSTVCLLARFLAGQPAPLPARIVWGSLVLAGVPAGLIFIQPDLGSASILLAIWFGLVWVVGASRRTCTVLAAGLGAAVPFGWSLLKEYQRDRLFAFINPHADPLGTGYTVIQSVIAIGSGRLWGRGWFAGTQNQLSFLPERHSDFIFSVIGEEWGFFGCVTVVILFGWLLSRMLHLAQHTGEPQGRLLAAGVFAWIAYQALVNMGMVMGLLPVVGVPLPLVSYGGSSMVVVWAALGLLQSLYRTELVR